METCDETKEVLPRGVSRQMKLSPEMGGWCVIFSQNKAKKET